MDWQRYVEQVYRLVDSSEINPKEHTEKGFFEWIVDRADVQTHLDTWLSRCENESKAMINYGEKAVMHKKQGNDYFKEGDYPGSVNCYTESARYSAGDKVIFSMGMANRSAAFFAMSRYNECLRDIEVALKVGYPKELSWKLHRRAAECHLKLRQGNLAEASIAELKNAVESSDTIAGAMKETILKQAEDLLSAVHECQKEYQNDEPPAPTKVEPGPEDILPENLIFPFASAAVVRENSPTRGRYVLARQPIKKGDIIFIEKPLAWVPVMQGYNDSLCAHCYEPFDDTVVPCKGCAEGLYCSTTCWNDAWSNHQWECAGYHMGMWQKIGVLHLAFKIFLISMTTSDKLWFNDVQNLETIVARQPSGDIFRAAIGSMLLTSYLEKYTNFLETIDLKECFVEKFDDPDMSFDFDISTKRGKKLYVGSMLLRHTLQMLANPFAVVRRSEASMQTENTTINSILTREKRRTTVGVYPSASMMNHSCDPTVKYYFWNNRLIVKAVKDIREGEEIFVCYGPDFRAMVKHERQMYLRSRYCFDCKCSACMNPLFDHYTDRFDGLKCPKCSGPAVRSPAYNSQRCIDCGASSNISCSAALLKAAELYDSGLDLSDFDKWKEAIPYFEMSLVIREKYMYKHNTYIAKTLHALGDAYAATGNWLKAISCLEKRIAAMEEKYGPDSLEVVTGLIRISEVCCEYLDHPNRKSSCRTGIVPLLSPTFRRCAVIFLSGNKPSLKTHEYMNTFIKSAEYGERILAVFSLIVDPWHDEYQEVNDNRQQLSGLLDMFRSL